MTHSRDPADLDGGVAVVLRRVFGFEEVVVGERLTGGYANDLFRVVADGRTLVLRVKHAPVVIEDLAWEHRVVRLLSDGVREVVAPVAARGGETVIRLGRRVGWLMPFVDGAPADAAREAHRAAAAGSLGRLHRAGARLGLCRRPGVGPLSELVWPPLRVPDQLREWSHTIARERAWAISYVSELAGGRRLDTTLVHGDFFPGNVLVAGDEVNAIIDWEEAHLDWSTWDLASAMAAFCEVDHDLDPIACERFVDAYRDGGGTAAAGDDDLLIPLARVKRTLEVLRAPTDRHPRWDHQQDNLRLLDNLATRSL
jgi:Ser/Thr protein kinase RdoA (MazF antagonist)